MREPSKKKQSAALVFLMGSTFFVALVVVIGLVLILSPAGSKRLGNVLIAPRDLDKEAKIELMFYEPGSGHYKKERISQRSYEEFFLKFSSLRSLLDVDSDVVRAFAADLPATLTILSNKEVWQVQFMGERHYFRLLQPQVTEWIYFESPDKYGQIIKLLTE